MLTTRAAMPGVPSRSAASTASPTSEPVAISVTASRRRGLAQHVARRAAASRGAKSAGRSSTAVFWRQSAISVGPSLRSSASPHAAAVSRPSAGRTTSRLGIARSAARCSTGWCVGPSSPTKMQSCVNTHTTGSFMSADSRIAGRA